jgi:hypothetical protein
MSASPSDILESESYNDNNTIAHCHECGASIDTEQDCYGVSIDGERFCCWDCRKEFAMLGTVFHKHYEPNGKWGGYASFDGEEVSTLRATETEALKRAEELAEYAWDVKSYCERG